MKKEWIYLYLLAAAFLLLTLATFGYLVPGLLSAKDSLANILGIIIITLYPIVLAIACFNLGHRFLNLTMKEIKNEKNPPSDNTAGNTSSL